MARVALERLAQRLLCIGQPALRQVLRAFTVGILCPLLGSGCAQRFFDHRLRRRRHRGRRRYLRDRGCRCRGLCGGSRRGRRGLGFRRRRSALAWCWSVNVRRLGCSLGRRAVLSLRTGSGLCSRLRGLDLHGTRELFVAAGHLHRLSDRPEIRYRARGGGDDLGPRFFRGHGLGGRLDDVVGRRGRVPAGRRSEH